jgi:hypothetical protein
VVAADPAPAAVLLFEEKSENFEKREPVDFPAVALPASPLSAPDSALLDSPAATPSPRVDGSSGKIDILAASAPPDFVVAADPAPAAVPPLFEEKSENFEKRGALDFPAVAPPVFPAAAPSPRVDGSSGKIDVLAASAPPDFVVAADPAPAAAPPLFEEKSENFEKRGALDFPAVTLPVFPAAALLGAPATAPSFRVDGSNGKIDDLAANAPLPDVPTTAPPFRVDGTNGKIDDLAANAPPDFMVAVAAALPDAPATAPPFRVGDTNGKIDDLAANAPPDFVVAVAAALLDVPAAALPFRVDGTNGKTDDLVANAPLDFVVAAGPAAAVAPLFGERNENFEKIEPLDFPTTALPDFPLSAAPVLPVVTTSTGEVVAEVVVTDFEIVPTYSVVSYPLIFYSNLNQLPT